MDPISIALSLAPFAPSIMRFFGAGEASTAVAEKVISIAKTVTGAQSPEEAIGAMQANAELASKFRLATLEADRSLEEAYLADRQNARARDVEFIKMGRNNVRGDVLAYAAVGTLDALVLALLFVKDIPTNNRELLFLAVGALVVIVKDVYGFEFGSSKDSQRNAQAVADALKAA